MRIWKEFWCFMVLSELQMAKVYPATGNRETNGFSNAPISITSFASTQAAGEGTRTAIVHKAPSLPSSNTRSK
jgi:hypothetical protein